MDCANLAGPPAPKHAIVKGLMATDDKATLYRRQALRRRTDTTHDQAMLNAAELARRFNEAFPKRGAISDREIADACDVTPQAVFGWRKTGRIHKSHLLILARLSGRGERYWLGDDTVPQEQRVLSLWSDLLPEQQQELLTELERRSAENRRIAAHLGARLKRVPERQSAAPDAAPTPSLGRIYRNGPPAPARRVAGPGKRAKKGRR